jgi:hypothetical protein
MRARLSAVDCAEVLGAVLVMVPVSNEKSLGAKILIKYCSNPISSDLVTNFTLLETLLKRLPRIR